MTERDEFAARITQDLGGAGIAYAICGSVAASLHGYPRMTQDIDILIEANEEQLEAFLRAIEARLFYVSRAAALEAERHSGMFNVIDAETGWKADLIFLKQSPYEQEGFRRRMRGMAPWGEAVVQTPEDVILSKLVWARESQSERQYQDAAVVAAQRWDGLDRDYLRRWAKELNVEDALKRMLAEAEDLATGSGRQ